MEQGLGNGSNAACVCLDSSWGKFTTPSHLGSFFFFPPRLLFEESEPNRYSRGRRGGFGERRARQQMERMDGEKASLELHVLSRDLPWRALQEQKKQQNTVN